MARARGAACVPRTQGHRERSESSVLGYDSPSRTVRSQTVNEKETAIGRLPLIPTHCQPLGPARPPRIGRPRRSLPGCRARSGAGGDATARPSLRHARTIPSAAPLIAAPGPNKPTPDPNSALNGTQSIPNTMADGKQMKP
eukprot:675204-Hanusia_phi.AAC.2